MVQRRKPSTLAGVTAAAILALLMTIPAHAQVTQEFHKTVPLSADGRVSLSNINGDVEITGWNKNEVQIDAVKTARDQQRLDEARIEVNANSNSVKIETHYPSHISPTIIPHRYTTRCTCHRTRASTKSTWSMERSMSSGSAAKSMPIW